MNCFKFTLNFRGYSNARTPIQTVESLWSLGFTGIERLILVKRKRERELGRGDGRLYQFINLYYPSESIKVKVVCSCLRK